MNFEPKNNPAPQRRTHHHVFSEKTGPGQIKLVFVLVAVVTVIWIGLLIYLGRELWVRAFA